ncbi:MAG: hypothetical protein C4308_04955 [Chitinophagaceae bacterium]
METMQSTPTTTATTITASNRGVLGSKIPASIAFLIGSLLFLLPFVDIKCNGVSLKKVSGAELVTGFEVNTGTDNSVLSNIERESTATVKKSEKKDPNIYAMAALGLGVLGFVISLLSFSGRPILGATLGILSFVAMIGLMLDVKKKVNVDVPNSNPSPGDLNIENTMKITADFTAFFWLAVIAFLAAAIFSFMQRSKSTA